HPRRRLHDEPASPRRRRPRRRARLGVLRHALVDDRRARDDPGATHGHRSGDHDAALLRLERALPGRPHAGLAPRFQCHQPAQLRGERPTASPARHVRQPARRLQRAAVRAGGRRRRGRGDPAPIGSLTWTASAVSIWDRLSRWASTALPPMTTRTALAAAGLVAALALAACGGGNASISARGTSTTTSTSTTATSVPPSTTVPPATSPPASTTRPTSGLKAIEYAGLRFQVPQEWPVYDLGKDPTRCVRFDQHAVYLGHAGANQ